jgi:molecular chaperone DnaK
VAEWCLGVDVGGTWVKAAACEAGGSAQPLELDPAGRPSTPSAVFAAEDGELITGSAAWRLGALIPERFEPSPRRLVGQPRVFLGDRFVDVADLIGAVVAAAVAEGRRQRGTAPTVVRLAHPAHWGRRRIGVLLDAAARVGVGVVEPIAEPDAAARHLARSGEEGDAPIAVLDVGSSTVAFAVVTRAGDGFALAARPVSRDAFGGDVLDDRIVQSFVDLLGSDEVDALLPLLSPSNGRERRSALLLRDEVRRAKEELSGSPAAEVRIPGIEREVQITREELERLAEDLAEGAVDLVEEGLAAADLAAGDLAALYLVGGSSEFPLIGDTVWRRLQTRPTLATPAGTAIACGAAAWAGPPPSPRRTRSVPADAAGGAAPGPDNVELVGFEPAVAVLLSADDWSGGYDVTTRLTLRDPSDPDRSVSVTDEPSVFLDSAALAARGERADPAMAVPYPGAWAGPNRVAGLDAGWERRYLSWRGRPVEMVERSVIGAGRATVVTAGRSVVGIADLVARRPSPSATWADVGVGVSCPDGWVITEQLLLRRQGTPYQVLVLCTTEPASIDTGLWAERQLAAVSVRSAAPPSRTAGRVCADLRGEIVTLRWDDRGVPMRTKLGIAVVGRRGFCVTITLPRDEQDLFPDLARHARLHPGSAAAILSEAASSPAVDSDGRY